jgi:hypothetical protein
VITPNQGRPVTDLLVAGAGPAGLTAAIVAARAGRSVRLLEAGPEPGRKLLASGGGRCNLTNTLPAEEFMARYGGHGRFMGPALARLDGAGLRAFLADLRVETHAPDGFHVFPTGHDARRVLDALLTEVRRLGVDLRTDRPVEDLLVADGAVQGVTAAGESLPARAVVLACGGRGYPGLGGRDDGPLLAAACGHRLVTPHPGMVPLLTREAWPARCTADTVPRARLTVRRKGKRRIEATGDLIFTRTGLAGPVVLDLAREITPLIATTRELSVDLELTGRGQDRWRERLEHVRRQAPRRGIADCLVADGTLAGPLAEVMCEHAGVDPATWPAHLKRGQLTDLASLLARIPVTVVDHAGWDRAMVMRGGVSLKGVDPETLASKHVRGLHLAGEMLDLDGPCGGFNLQWAFASGYLAGASAAEPHRGGDSRFPLS